MVASTLGAISCRTNTHASICLNFLFIAVKKKGSGTEATKTLELLFEAPMLIMSQREQQKTLDLREATARPVYMSEVQMIQLTWRKKWEADFMSERVQI